MPGRRLFLNWREDSFLSRNGSFLVYDKLEHALLGFLGMTFSALLFALSSVQVFFLLCLIWNGIGFFWELAQCIINRQLIQPKDIAANNIGFVLTFPFYL